MNQDVENGKEVRVGFHDGDILNEKDGIDKTKGSSKPRKKLWRCVYPGCNEPEKTYYNCHSHVWDCHVRYELPQGHPLASFTYKHLPDREHVKTMCKVYLVELGPSRKRVVKKKSPPVLILPPSDVNNRIDFSLFGNQTQINPTSTSSSFQQFMFDDNVSNSNPNLTQSNQFFLQTDENNPSPMMATPPFANSIVNANMNVNMNMNTNVNVNSNMNFIDSENAFSTEQSSWTTMNDSSQSLIASYSPDQQDDFLRIIPIRENLKRLHVCGEVFAEAGFFQRSDERFKTDIVPIKNALEKVIKLTGRSFRYIGDSKIRMGFIAQELKEVVPEAVIKLPDETYGVDVVALVPYVVQALNEIHKIANDCEDEKLKQFDIAIFDALQTANECERQIDIIRQEQIEMRDQIDSLTKINAKHNKKNNARKHARNSSVYLSADKAAQDYAKSDSKSCCQGENTGKSFQYRFVFLPSLIVPFITIVFVAGGLFMNLFGSPFPFISIFCIVVGIVIVLSLFVQRNELNNMLRSKIIRLYWTESMTLNWLAIATTFVFGLSMSTLMGEVGWIFPVIFFITIFLYWVVSIRLYKRLHIPLRSLVILYIFILFFYGLVYAILFIIQPHICKFDYNNDRSFVFIADKGKFITPLSLNSVPWNCSYRQLVSVDSLPSGLKIYQGNNSVLPYLYGSVNEEFQTNFFLSCLGNINLFCGTVAFKLIESSPG